MSMESRFGARGDHQPRLIVGRPDGIAPAKTRKAAAHSVRIRPMSPSRMLFVIPILAASRRGRQYVNGPPVAPRAKAPHA